MTKLEIASKIRELSNYELNFWNSDKELADAYTHKELATQLFFVKKEFKDRGVRSQRSYDRFWGSRA